MDICVVRTLAKACRPVAIRQSGRKQYIDSPTRLETDKPEQQDSHHELSFCETYRAVVTFSGIHFFSCPSSSTNP
jgi:hypothetical protein